MNNSYFIETITKILENKSLNNDLESLNKTNGTESTIHFSIANKNASIQLLNDNTFNINVNNKNVLNANNNIINIPFGINTNNITSNNILNINSPIINIIGQLNINGQLINNSSNTFNNSVTMMSSLNVSGTATFNTIVGLTPSSVGLGNVANTNPSYLPLSIATQNAISSLDTFNNSITLMNSLNVSGYCNIYNDITLNSNLTVSGYCNIYNDITLNSNLTVSGYCNIYNDITLNSNLTVSGYCNIYSNLAVSGYCNIYNDITLNSNLTVSGNTTMKNNLTVSDNTTINSNLTVSGNTVIKSNLIMNIIKNTTIFNTCILTNLPHFSNINDAYMNGVPIWGVYRTGSIINILTSETPPIIILNGPSIVNINMNTIYIEPGLLATDMFGNNVEVNVSSIITSDIGEILINNSNLSELTNLISTLYFRTYIITYNAIDIFSNISNIQRTVNVLIDAFPVFTIPSTLSYSNNNIIYTQFSSNTIMYDTNIMYITKYNGSFSFTQDIWNAAFGRNVWTTLSNKDPNYQVWTTDWSVIFKVSCTDPIQPLPPAALNPSIGGITICFDPYDPSSSASVNNDPSVTIRNDKFYENSTEYSVNIWPNDLNNINSKLFTESVTDDMYKNDLLLNNAYAYNAVYYGVYYINQCFSVKAWDYNGNLIFKFLSDTPYTYKYSIYPFTIYIQEEFAPSFWYNGFIIDTTSNAVNANYQTYIDKC